MFSPSRLFIETLKAVWHNSDPAVLLWAVSVTPGETRVTMSQQPLKATRLNDIKQGAKLLGQPWLACLWKEKVRNYTSVTTVKALNDS